MLKRKTMTCTIITLVLCLAISINVSASNGAVTFSTMNVEGEMGSEVVVPISISNNFGFVSASLMIEYDDTALSLVSVNDAGLISGAMHTPSYTSPYYLTWENDTKRSNITTNGILVNLVFVVSELADAGEYPIKVCTEDQDCVLTMEGTPVSCNFISGSIIVKAKECAHEWSGWSRSSSTKHKHTCNLCGEYEYERHEWDRGVITEEPTETDVGIRLYTCEICSGTKSEIIPVLPEKTKESVLSVSATGKKVYGGASVTLELSNTGKDAESCRIAVAAFNSTGRMLDVEIANLTVNGEASLSKTLSLTTSETISKVKLFYLDDRWVPAGDVQLVTLK